MKCSECNKQCLIYTLLYQLMRTWNVKAVSRSPISRLNKSYPAPWIASFSLCLQRLCWWSPLDVSSESKTSHIVILFNCLSFLYSLSSSVSDTCTLQICNKYSFCLELVFGNWLHWLDTFTAIGYKDTSSFSVKHVLLFKYTLTMTQLPWDQTLTKAFYSGIDTFELTRSEPMHTFIFSEGLIPEAEFSIPLSYVPKQSCSQKTDTGVRTIDRER